MRNLIDFLQSHLYWLVFLALEVVSLISLFKYNDYQGSVYFTTANRTVGTIYQWASNIETYIHLGHENAILEETNEKLRRENLALKSHIDALTHPKDTIPYFLPADSTLPARTDSTAVRHEIPPFKSYSLVGARVVSATTHRANNLITIDKGEADGIRREMGVVCSSGVVGVIFQTSEHFSIVIPLINSSSHISCRLRRTEFFGTIRWKQGNPSLCTVSGLPTHTQAKKGDIIETNGFSDIFPAGIPIGKVERTDIDVNDVNAGLSIRLFTDFATLRSVSVITNYTNLERKQLEQQADSAMRVISKNP